MVAVPALYLLFVAHYAVNMPYEDDWITVVPLIHAALHARLTFGSLWMQYGPNRIFFPALILVYLGVFTHDDIRVAIALSAVIFVATFFVFLAIFRSYQGRPLTPLVVLALGAVWFSLESWYDALWAFQLIWYLTLFCLMVMIYLLQIPPRRSITLPLAVVVAVVASFSALPGLALWPVGLICLVWTLPRDPRRWERNERIEVLVWCVAAIGTAVVFLWGYRSISVGCGVGGGLQFTGCGSALSSALHHPVNTAEFIVVLLGEVVPNTHTHFLWLSGLLGAVLLAVAVFIIVQSVRNRHHDRNCLPVALILFGLLFDVEIAVGRVGLLSSLAPGSVYKMPNVLILVAIVSYAWVHLRVEPGKARRTRLVKNFLFSRSQPCCSSRFL